MYPISENSPDYDHQDELDLAFSEGGRRRKVVLTTNQLYLLQRAIRALSGESGVKFTHSEARHLDGIKDRFWDTAVYNRADASTREHLFCL